MGLDSERSIHLETKEIREGLVEYLKSLATSELSLHTRNKYSRDIIRFLAFITETQSLEKENVIAYKQHLIGMYKISTVNSYLISLNRYFKWLRRNDLTVKTIKTQRKSGLENILTADEYTKLLMYCLSKRKDKTYLLLRTLAGTGIRVGELSSISRESAEHKIAAVTSKGKHRRIFISSELSQLLLDYCHRQCIHSGIIFHGQRKDAALHPSGVWKALKRIAKAAGIDPSKVYPHSMRHLFAKTYMEKVGNIFELADLLGHSSVETTRIYARTSEAEKHRRVEALLL